MIQLRPPSRRMALLGVPVLLTLHNAEEALFVPAALREVAARLPPSLAGSLPSPGQMHAALAVATVVPWLAWLLGSARGDSRTGTRVLLLLQCVVLANVAWHAAAAVALGGYAPGVATALALNLPFSAYLLRRAAREGWVSRRALAGLIALGVAVHAPGAVVLLRLGGAASAR